MPESPSAGPAPFALAAGQGEDLWFFGGLMTLLATGEQTGGSFCLAEELRPSGTPTPLHRQPNEDETFIVLEGEITVHVDGVDHVVAAGGTAFVPPGAPHAFKVSSDTARLLILNTPGGHENFFRELGEPAPRREIPPPADGPPDAAHVTAVAARHGTEILGPPPWT